jgi:polysaccharide pyruvyl transferase WcaK-like protein
MVGDIRGGDSFSDIYGVRRFVLGFFEAWSVILVRGSLVQFPQTFGPYKRRLVQWLARYLLRRSSCIIARDKQSRNVAQALVGAGKRVLLSPDVAFSLDAVRPARIEFDPPVPVRDGTARGLEHEASRAGVPGNAIGLNVNGLMYNGGYTRKNMFELRLDYPSFLPALVTALLREHDGELWLVPHTLAPGGNVESDPEASRKVRDSVPLELRSRVRIVTKNYDQHEIKGVIGLCDFFVGSRMHACIAALSQGIPCVGVAYSMKFAGVFDSIGMGEWVVDGRQSNNDHAVTRVLELYRLRNNVRAELHRRAEGARVQLNEIFSRLVTDAKPCSAAAYLAVHGEVM